MGQKDKGQRRRRMVRGMVARVLLVALFGVLMAGAGLALRPIAYTLGDATWLIGDTVSSVPLD
ncbi:hypothetical protein GCM10009682_00830 [Luedemannella flava]|uniref:Uncharacterized protein n=1 Tax=Luedemannella flava TaxID=349316 RepID=A0ABP4XJS2_9ACTN